MSEKQSGVRRNEEEISENRVVRGGGGSRGRNDGKAGGPQQQQRSTTAAAHSSSENRIQQQPVAVEGSSAHEAATAAAVAVGRRPSVRAEGGTKSARGDTIRNLDGYKYQFNVGNTRPRRLLFQIQRLSFSWIFHATAVRLPKTTKNEGSVCTFHAQPQPVRSLYI